MSYYNQYGANSAPRKGLSEKEAQRVLKTAFADMVAKHLMPVFEQGRTGHRVIETLQAMLTMGVGRRTVTNSLIARGMEQESWSSNYRCFSEGKWNPINLFHGVFRGSLPLLNHPGPVVVGIDDSGLPKVGETIENTGWIHNPLVPKYVHPAIQWGVPVLHAALLIPGEIVHRPTAITIAFDPIPRDKAKGKKGKKAEAKAKVDATKAAVPGEKPTASAPKKRGRPTKAESERMKAERDALIRNEESDEAHGAVTDVKLKATELCVRVIIRIRRWMDEAGMAERPLLIVGDNSYTNGTVMVGLPHDTEYVGRTKEDSSLQAIATTKGGKLKYGAPLPTPKEMAVQHLLDVNVEKFHYAGRHRDLKFLAVGPVFRKTSTRRKLLRLLILEPVPFGRGPGQPKGYNRRAYLLTTDHSLPAKDLVQAYLMRWELEVIHRIWKTDLGIGDAQVRKHKIPAAMAAYYALLWPPREWFSARNAMTASVAPRSGLRIVATGSNGNSCQKASRRPSTALARPRSKRC